MKKIIFFQLAALVLGGCAFLIQPVDTGAHVFWDSVKSGRSIIR